jgi:hypothetical protein
MPKSFEDFAIEQGWTPETQVCVLLRYIENQDSDACFTDFLEEQADDENSASDDLSEDEDEDDEDEGEAPR